jgi:hypothetical protein
VIVGWLKMQAIEYGLTLIVAPLAVLVMQGLKRTADQVEQLPPWAKRGTVVAIAAACTAAGHVLGVDFGVTPETGLAAIPQGAVETAIAAALAMALHALKPAKKNP